KVYGYLKNKQIKEGYLFWLGLLNSDLFWYFIQQTGYVLRGGYFTFKTNYIFPFPVPSEIPDSINIAVESLVKSILEKKRISNNIDTSFEEKEVNKYIYELYGISDIEIEIIEKKQY
ncbi:hypothetical protein ACLI1A_19535, partial [Flavobacterium sp. RHBU_3]|uniref:hypothetical protein n=1 Tax=Flavobacterium sp. RHBU_3 TaxID=3391184 RepID=UPI003984E2C7